MFGEILDFVISIPAHAGNIRSHRETSIRILFQFPHTRETFGRNRARVEKVVSIPAHVGNIYQRHFERWRIISIPAHAGNIFQVAPGGLTVISIPAHAGNIVLHDARLLDGVSIPAHAGNIGHQGRQAGDDRFNSRTRGKHRPFRWCGRASGFNSRTRGKHTLSL